VRPPPGESHCQKYLFKSKVKKSREQKNVGLCAYSLLIIISVLIRLANLGAGDGRVVEREGGRL
jgi:hypothetical protein